MPMTTAGTGNAGYGELRRHTALEHINGVLKLRLPKEKKRSVNKKQIDI
ncbi:hypothetical protein [uncultured Marinococcus sp.]|nr:hypothetical protein [uncultured Marinococcus sp.]